MTMNEQGDKNLEDLSADPSMADPNPISTSEEKGLKAPNVFERAKEEIEAMVHHDKSPRHEKETHGTSDDIDENTPIDDVKGPGVIQRMKEEVEAVVEAIHPKKDSKSKAGTTS